MDHGDRRAPITLPRDAPVFDPVCDCRFAEGFLLGLAGHDAARLFARQSGVGARVLNNTVLCESGGYRFGTRELTVHWPDDGADRNAVLLAEFEVALIVSGNGHDSARAISHQHEVADPNRKFLAAVWIDGVLAGEEALLFEIAGSFGRAR